MALLCLFCAMAGDARVVVASKTVVNTDRVFFIDLLLFGPPDGGIKGKTAGTSIYSCNRIATDGVSPTWVGIDIYQDLN